MIMKKKTQGRSCLLRKRKFLETMVYSQDQEEMQEEPTAKEKLTCLVRNFILKQASLHNTYDETNGTVALPCLVQVRSGNPRTEIHLQCLCNYELTQEERRELEFEDRVGKAIKE